MPQIDPTLPEHGDLVWDQVLNPAIEQIVDATNAVSQTVENGRLNQSVLDAGVDAAVTAYAEPLGLSDVTKSVLNDTYGTLATVDLAKFLLPGETMPDDGTTDASVLFNRAKVAVAATYAATGVVVTIRIPAGTFKITSSVKWYTGYHGGFIGAGRGVTKIMPTGSAVFGLMDTGYDINTFLDDVIISDLTIDCTNQVGITDNSGAKGIALRYLRNFRFDRVRVINSWATAFGCDFLQKGTFTDCTSLNSGVGIVTSFENIGAGFGIGVGNFDNESVTFVNCHAVNSKSGGFFFERLAVIPAGAHDGRGQTMTGCTTSGGYDGLHDAGADGLIVQGCHFIGASNAGVHISGYTSGGRHGGRNGNFAKNVVRGNAVGVSIGIASTGSYTFENNEVSANTGAAFIAPVNSQIGAGWRWLSNRIFKNGAGGIILDTPLLSRPEIRGNIIRDNGSEDGIRISGDCWEPRIIDNVVQGHVGVGLNLSNAATFLTGATIRGNRLTGNVFGGLVNVKTTDDSTGITDNVSQAAFTTITNYVADPCFTLGVSPIAVLGGFSAPVAVTGATDAKYGSTYARLTVNAAGTALARVASIRTATPGVWTLGVLVRAPKDAVLRLVAAGLWGSDALQRTWQNGGIRSTGDWQYITITVTLPSTGSGLDLNLAIDSATVGMVADVMGLGMSPGPVAWPAFDGAHAPTDSIPTATAAWSGTPAASPSVLTFGDPLSTTLAGRLYRASNEVPLAIFEGSTTIPTVASGYSIPTAQPLSLYSVYAAAPAASARSSLRTSTSADRLATGRNSGNSAWIGISNNAAGANTIVSITAAAAAAVLAVIRNSAGVTLKLRGGTTATATIPTYEDVIISRVSASAGATSTVAFAGAHDDTKRDAILAVLAAWYAIP